MTEKERHYKNNCPCDPYILEYKVHFHRDKDGHFIGVNEGYEIIIADFSEYLNEAFLEMQISEIADRDCKRNHD